MRNRIIYPWFKSLNHETKYLKFISKAVLKKEMTMGNKTYQLEKILKKILKVKHVILTTSGTSALTMAAIALGTNSRTKILCTDMTWIATINPSKISKCFDIVYITDKICEKGLSSNAIEMLGYFLKLNTNDIDNQKYKVIENFSMGSKNTNDLLIYIVTCIFVLLLVDYIFKMGKNSL